MKLTKIRGLIGLLGIAMLIPVADAQRTTAGLFEGIWKGTLTMDVIYDVPQEHLERLSKPVQLEIRMLSRGQAELVFTSPENEWDFREYRNFRVTPIGQDQATAENGVIVARIPGNLDWTNSISINMAKQGPDQILVSWARLTTRNEMLYNGMDEFGFSGVAIFDRAR